MKKTIVFFCALMIAAASFSTASAQQTLQLKLGYNFNMPIGSFKDVISNTSYRGFNADLLYPVNTKLSVGLGVAYSDFYQKYPRDVYETKDGTISAVVTNSVQTTPVLIKANYTLTNSGVIRPYIGAGAGIDMINFHQYLGEFADEKITVKPALQASAGFNIPFTSTGRSGFTVGANYNYLPFNYNGIKTLDNWGVQAGFFFPLQ